MKHLDTWKLSMANSTLTNDDIEELADHLIKKTEELVTRGLTEDEAWIIAEHELGKASVIKGEFGKVNNKPAWITSHLMVVGIMGFLLLQVITFIGVWLSESVKLGSSPFFNIYSAEYALIVSIIIITIAAFFFNYRSITQGLSRSFSFKKIFSNSSRFITGIAAGGLICIVSGFIFMEGSKCNNTNPVFQNFTKESARYKKELARQFMKIGTDNIKFTFRGYEQKHNRQYILVGASSKVLCAEAWIEVKDWENLQGIKRTKGAGYHGAELVGLSVDFIENSSEIGFVLKHVENVVD